MNWLYLAQDSELLKGNVQDVLAWVILAIVVLYTATVGYFIKRQIDQEDKYDKLQSKVMKLTVRSNRAIEALADLPPPPVEEDLKRTNMVPTKKTDQELRDAEIDRLLESNDEHLQHLLEVVKQEKKTDSGFIKCRKHHKRTKQIMETLKEADLEDSREINGAHK